MRVLLSWSGGKDCALALAVLRDRHDVEVAGLLTTVDDVEHRVAMHGVSRGLVEAQAAAVELPLWAVELPHPCANTDYERIMAGVCARARAEGIEAVAFGDLFLEDIRSYREANMKKAGLPAIFPLWTDAGSTASLARETAATLTAHVVCIDPKVMPSSTLGARYDDALLDALPPGVDPMGERGEMHTFVSDAPGFSAPLAVTVGAPIRERDGFLYATVTCLPALTSRQPS